MNVIHLLIKQIHPTSDKGAGSINYRPLFIAPLKTRTMKKSAIILLSFLAITSTALAQTEGSIHPNNVAAARDASGGRFELALNPSEKMQVAYELAPLHPVDKAHFLLHTPDPMPFTATITNSKGKTVYRWKPEQKVYLYQADWDLSGLKSGEYTVNIFTDNQAGSIHQFRFTKQ